MRYSEFDEVGSAERSGSRFPGNGLNTMQTAPYLDASLHEKTLKPQIHKIKSLLEKELESLNQGSLLCLVYVSFRSQDLRGCGVGTGSPR
jgi:hypothetical protein